MIRRIEFRAVLVQTDTQRRGEEVPEAGVSVDTYPMDRPPVDPVITKLEASAVKRGATFTVTYFRKDFPAAFHLLRIF